MAKKSLDIQKEDKLQLAAKDIQVILEKYNIGFKATPFISADGRIGANLEIVDMEEKKND